MSRRTTALVPGKARRENLFSGFGPVVIGLIVLSLVSNVLVLTGPLFMMQVYDRVLNSRSVPTLVALTIIVAVLFAFYGVIDALRLRISNRLGDALDERIRPSLFHAGLAGSLRSRLRHDPVADGDAVHAFITNGSALAFLDLPWALVYICVVFVLHSTIGWVALACIAVQLALMLLNELVSARAVRSTRTQRDQRRLASENGRQGVEEATAMGMIEMIESRWEESTRQLRASEATTTDQTTAIGATGRAATLFSQSLVLASGAYFVILDEMSPGSIIAATVTTARAIAIISQVVGRWRSFQETRDASRRIAEVLALPANEPPTTQLPAPSRSFTVEDASLLSTDRSRVLLRNIDLTLPTGSVLGVLGAAGAGKSTLAQVCVGVRLLTSGRVLLDGAEICQYGDRLGTQIGYVPQRIELFDGTVAANIARFSPTASSAQIITAARQAGVHEAILSLPAGYDTIITQRGTELSGGQRQLVALARALYGNPFLLVLDEPDASLDNRGESALHQALRALRSTEHVVVIVTHRPSLLPLTTHILMLQEGRQVLFGPREKTLKAALEVIDR